MLQALIVFLVGCLILAVVIWVFNLIMGMIDLPAQIKQIATIIVSLVLLLVLILITLHSLGWGGAGGFPVIGP
jgi:hypothetical protein